MLLKEILIPAIEGGPSLKIHKNEASKKTSAAGKLQRLIDGHNIASWIIYYQTGRSSNNCRRETARQSRLFGCRAGLLPPEFRLADIMTYTSCFPAGFFYAFAGCRKFIFSGIGTGAESVLTNALRMV